MQRVSQPSATGPADGGAIDLRFRTTTGQAGAGMRRTGSPDADHQRFALMTHKVNDDLHPRHVQQAAGANGMAVQPDRMASGASSLSDHSPFMIARIMTDLNQYRQQDPKFSLNSGSEFWPTVRVVKEEAATNKNHHCSRGQGMSRYSVPVNPAHGAGEGTGTAPEAAHISASSAGSSSLHKSERLHRLSAVSPSIRKKRKGAPALRNAVTSKKRQQKQLSEVANPHHQNDNVASHGVGGAIGRGTGIVVNPVTAAAAAASDNGERGNDLTAKCERQCSRHACAFPGCDKVYGKDGKKRGKQSVSLSLCLFVLVTQPTQQAASCNYFSSLRFICSQENPHT